MKTTTETKVTHYDEQDNVIYLSVTLTNAQDAEVVKILLERIAQSIKDQFFPKPVQKGAVLTQHPNNYSKSGFEPQDLP